MKAALLVIICTTCLIPTLKAQFLELGASAGATAYRGDVSPGFRLSHIRGGGSVYVKNILNKGIQLKHQLGYWYISGSDLSYSNTFQKNRGHSFSNSFLEITSRIEYHFLDYRNKKHDFKLTPYITTGVGIFYILGNLPDTKPIARIQPVIPWGMGLKYPIGRQWNIGFEILSHKTFTDYLDNKGYQASDPKNTNGQLTGTDWYFVAAFHAGYTLYWVRCPKASPSIDKQQ